MGDERRRRPGPLGLAFGLGATITVFGRTAGMRSGSESTESLLGFADVVAVPRWLSPLADVVVATAFVALALATLVGRSGLAAHITSDHVAIVPAAACACVGAAAMSATMATAIEGPGLGVEIFVIVTALVAVAIVVVATMGGLMVFSGLRIYALFDRMVNPRR
jgi:hypothetical protein